MNPTLTPKQRTKKVPKTSISAFVTKLYEILEDAQYLDIVDWNADGTEIIIKKADDFPEKVLSTYFKHKNLNSFVRQLNMYNFHKKRTNNTELHYRHELFQRGKKHLLTQIKRKNQEVYIDSSEDANEEVSSTEQEFDVAKLVQERLALRKISNQAADKINCLEGRIKDLTFENENLKLKLKKQEEKDQIVFSLMANILRKYGIPPTELGSILYNTPSETSPLINPLTNAGSTTPNQQYQEPNLIPSHNNTQYQEASGNCLNNESTSSFTLSNNRTWNDTFKGELNENMFTSGISNTDGYISYLDSSNIGKRQYQNEPQFITEQNISFDNKVKKFQPNYEY